MIAGKTLSGRTAKADLHLHSMYSEHPSEWFLQRLGAKESYTDPETIYRMAKDRGMDFVTITDHNRIEGALILRDKYPDDTFTGVEFTTYFPEDGCKIHILVYGLGIDDFDELQRARSNIYQMRDCLTERDLVHSVAHATYPVNGILEMDHLEKLILMFNLFEGINGGRNRINNRVWTRVLDSVDENRIEDLRVRHSLEPQGRTPWIKGLTGGSDDHAGLFVGETYTQANGSTPLEFVDSLRRLSSMPRGRSNTYQALVFAVYKIAYDFSRQNKSSNSRNLASALTEFIFEKREFKLREKLFLKKLTHSGGERANLYSIVNDLISDIRREQHGSLEKKLDMVYNRIAELTDEFVKLLVGSIRKDATSGDLVNFAANASASLPGIFLSLPFFTAVRDMFNNKELLNDLKATFNEEGEIREPRKTMWFTDTLTDLNGVSVTLRKIAQLAESRDPGVRIVTALTEDEAGDLLTENIVCLPYTESFSLPGYEKYLIKIPSILKALNIIAEYEPDEIFVSTPGPVGLTGLMIARLMSIRATGFFHTDYSRQATKIVSDESVNDVIESFIKWFFSCFDEIRVPTCQYMDILKKRGYNGDLLTRFIRGIDTDEFLPTGNRTIEELETRDPAHSVLVYTGRISRDKDLDLLIGAFRRVLEEYPHVSLKMVGDGPYLDELREKCSDLAHVKFLGRIPNKELPELYSSSDIFVFPSDSDTFGMSVLEAQACGLPAVVSSVGGPREIIENGVTGIVARAGDMKEWIGAIEKMLQLRIYSTEKYFGMRVASRNRVLSEYDWKNIYCKLFSK